MSGIAGRKEHYDIYEKDGTQSGLRLFLLFQISI